jgi:scyllo-inositol 2-dehydrogenase (NADP+)
MNSVTPGPGIRTAVVGYGLSGSVFHAPLIAATDEMTLSAIVTADPDRAAAAAQRYPQARVVASVDELLRHREDLDLVVVASPNASHVPVALAAIRAGLAVVVDKPVAPTVAAARELRAAAIEAGVVLSVFHNRRWDGDMLTVRDLLAAGELGRVTRFESRYERWRPVPRAGVWREQATPGTAGGLLFDLGSHLIDQSQVLFGPVSTVYSEVRVLRPGAEVDDDVFLTLGHANGIRSHLYASSVAADHGPRFRVLGTAAAYVKFGLDGQEEALRSGGSPRDPGWGREPESTWGQLGTTEQTRPVPTRPGAYQEYYEQLCAALRGRGPIPVTIDEACAVIGIIEAAKRSTRENMVVEVTPAER